MSLIGNIGAYEKREPFSKYVRRVKNYFKVNKIEGDAQVPAFLTLIGIDLYGLAGDLMNPKQPEECTLEELIKNITEHLEPAPIVIAERHRFYSRVQANDESVSEFLAAIKALAATCEFNNLGLEEMLRDRLVMGMSSEQTRKVLLTERNLSFKKAVDVAIGREAAEQGAKEVGQFLQGASGNVLAINSNNNHANKKYNQKPTNSGRPRPYQPCRGCGSRHWNDECPFRNAKCHNCDKTGHIAKVCYTKSEGSTKQPRKNVNSVVDCSASNWDSNSGRSHGANFQNTGEYDHIFQCSQSTTTNKKKQFVDLLLQDSVNVTFQVDTGSDRTIMSEREFFNYFPEASTRPTIYSTAAVLKKYGAESIEVLGEFYTNIQFAGTIFENEAIVVVKDNGPNLLGNDKLDRLGIKLHIPTTTSVNSVNTVTSKSISDKFPILFDDKLGTFKGAEVSLEVDESKSAKFFKARNVPYAMRTKVDVELDNLLKNKIIEPVSYSKWAAPIVPVLKPDGTVRICGDYRLTANQACVVNKYPVPRIDDLFATLGGGTVFSKLDMKSAYNQLCLAKESKPLTTINTHRGLFQYNRLCFGIASAPGIFQQLMDNLLKSIPGVAVFLDDILVTGSNRAEHDARLCEVLGKLQEAGLKLHPTKCEIAVLSVQYLGYSIDATGLKPTPEKVDAIMNAPEPTDVTQLRSYLGMLNFYRKFLERAAQIQKPLNALLEKDIKWEWSSEQKEAFRESKKALLDSCLVHFDPSLPMVVSADSSNYGLGAVLCHLIENVERPVVFVSRTLNKAEQNYCQTEKEALALIFALKRFHHYLWGSKFTLITDHKPLLGLFNPNKPIPEMASGRIQRWSLMLQAYTFDLFHRSGKSLGTADALSRLPLNTMPDNVPVCTEWVNLVDVLDSTPITANDISKWTTKDPLLSKLLLYIGNGWPTNTEEIEPNLKPYFYRKDELSSEQGCILWGSRVIIPEKGREAMLRDIHREHLGSTKMKQLARSYFWWPKLDEEIERVSTKCSVCLANQATHKKPELHPWDWPKKPWLRVHADYAGPVLGNYYFLIMTDAHSKWIEILPTKDISSSAKIDLMRNFFF